MNRLLSELRRRNVFRVAAAYLVVGWLLMQIVSVMTPALEMPGWVDGFFAILLIVGFPIAMLLAWAFEMTPEGMKFTIDVADGESIAPQTGRKFDILTLVALVAVIGLIGWQQLNPRTADEQLVSEAAPAGLDAGPPPTSIAVLPFEDLSPAGDQRYFAEGMSEEILNVLAQIDGLSVASRTSAFQFRGGQVGVPAISAELNVRYVLEGSLRRSGDNVRITAQLIDAVEDRHLWSQTFDRPLTVETVFAVQDEIAQAIVAAMGGELGLEQLLPARAATPTDSIEAYDLYLTARAFYRARLNMNLAEELFAEAVTLDPNFAAGLAMRAANLALSPIYISNHHATRADVILYAERALEFDPSMALAHAVIGYTEFNNPEATDYLGNVDWDEVFDRLDRAIALDPTEPEGLAWRGFALWAIGDRAGALEQAERSLATQDHVIFYSLAAYSALALGEEQRSLAHYQSGLERGLLTPNVGTLLYLAATEQMHDFLVFSSLQPYLSSFHNHLGLYEALRDPDGDHSAVRARLIAGWTASPVGMWTRNALLAALGDHSSAPALMAVWLPGYGPYRQSDTFKHQVRETGLYEYWQTHGFPPQCRALGDDDFECD